MTKSPSPKPETQNQNWTLVIVSLYIVLGVIYSLVTPVLEASDEFKHYPYIQYVQTRHKLPVLDPETCRESPEACPWKQDGGQPPAYYALMAAVTSRIDTSDLPELRRLNKHAFIGDPGQICNKNLIIHRPGRERFPWQGAVLAIHLIRFVTLLFGAGTVGLTYLLARELFPERPSLALGATALTAFNPMFLFVSASVNNDALAILIGNLVLLMMVKIGDWRAEVGRWRLTWQVALLGLVIGLGLLTKLSLLGLIPLALLLVAIRTRRQYSQASPLRRWGFVVCHLSLIILMALAISGWWFLRNWRLYGDPTGLNVFFEIQGRRPAPPTLQGWLGEFTSFRWTYWGLFGGVNVMAPRWTYVFFDLLSLIGSVGLVIWIIRNSQSVFRILIPLLWAGTLFASALRWNWIYTAFQGRLIFPAIAGNSLLLMLGLGQWVPQRYRPRLGWSVALGLLVIAALLPFIAIGPAYARPEPLTLSDVPGSAHVEPMEASEDVQVVGWEFEPRSIRPEDESAFVDVVVYWQAVASDETNAKNDRNHVSFARLLGREHELVGQINRHTACGMVPTGLWEPSQVWRDPYHIPVSEDAAAPSRLRVEVGLYDPEEDETLGSVAVGQAKLAPPESAPETAHPLKVRLEDGISLRGYDLTPAEVSAGGTVTLTLHWAARKAPSTDYQVFVHLLEDKPRPVAQGDGPPLMGDYPTSMWAAGEVIADPHPVALPSDLPPGEYHLLVGMYDLETMKRLPRLDGAGGGIEIPTVVKVH